MARKRSFEFQNINANYFRKKGFRSMEIPKLEETEFSKALKKELDEINKADQEAWLRVKDIIFDK